MTAPRRAASGAAVLRPELTEAVVDAVLDELAETGYARLSMQRVAARAGVGKSALYRRWAGKHEMVMDVVGRFGVQDGPAPDTGSLRGDLRALLAEMRDWLTRPRLRDITPDLVAETRRSPELAATFRDRLAAPRRAWGHTVLRRAADRGEIAADRTGDATLELVLDVIGSAPYWRLAVLGGEVADADLDRLVDLLTRGLSGSG